MFRVFDSLLLPNAHQQDCRRPEKRYEEGAVPFLGLAHTLSIYLVGGGWFYCVTGVHIYIYIYIYIYISIYICIYGPLPPDPHVSFLETHTQKVNWTRWSPWKSSQCAQGISPSTTIEGPTKKAQPVFPPLAALACRKRRTGVSLSTQK